MFKHSLLCLLMASTTAFAISELPSSDRRFIAPVTVQTANQSSTLTNIFQALGVSVGLTVVTENVPADKMVNYSIVDKPFRDVWNVLIKANGLDYELLQNDIIIVGPTSVIEKFRSTGGNITATPVPTRRLYTVNNEPDDIVSFLKSEVPGASVTRLGKTNTLAITGIQKQQEEISQLLANIDIPQPKVAAPVAEPTVRKLYTLNGDPTEILEFLKSEIPKATYTRVGKSDTISITGTTGQHNEISDLLSRVDPTKSDNSGATPLEPTFRRFYTTNTEPDDIISFLKTELPKAVVTRLGKSNTLSITASSSQQDEIDNFLSRIDVKSPTEVVVQQTYALSYAKAEDVRKILTSTNLGTTTVTVPTAGTAQAAANTASANSNKPEITADPRTNTLIIRGTQYQVSQVMELLPDLDKRVPQVNIQVRIQEITRSASNSLGIDWNAGFGNFTTTLTKNGLVSFFDPTRVLAGFNIGAALDALETQGLSKRVDDSTMTIQSGQSSASSLQSGGEQGFVFKDKDGQNQLQAVKYGVQISFSDVQVSNDGNISFAVDAKVEDKTDSANGAVYDKTNRSATTKLSFKTGSTVLLGGLLSTKTTNSTSGTPILSSLPLIGSLFKRTDLKESETQLLLVLTANVVE